MIISRHAIGMALMTDASSDEPARMRLARTTLLSDRENQVENHPVLQTVVNPRAAVPREIQLLLACARTNLNPEIATQIKSLVQQGLDWKYVFKKANENF